VFAANRTWTNSGYSAGSGDRGKWGTSFASNWRINLVPTASDVGWFGSTLLNGFSISVQPNTQVGGIGLTSITTGNAFGYRFSTNAITVGSQGIQNVSGKIVVFSPGAVLSADQTWSGSGVGSAMAFSAVDLNGYNLITSTDVEISTLNQNGGTASTLTVSGGNLSITGGGPSSLVNFAVSSGTLSTLDGLGGGGFDTSLSALSVASTGVYNNTKLNATPGQTTWDQVTMSSGTIDLMGVGGLLVTNGTNGYAQSGGTIKQYVGYDPGLDALVSSLIQATDGGGSMTGPLSFGGTLDIDFTGSGAETFVTGAGWQLFQGVVTGTTSFSSVLLENVDPASPYYGLTFHAAENGDFWTDASAVNGQQLVFYRDTGQLVVVPEPSTIVFAGIGVAMCGWTMLKRRRLGRVIFHSNRG